MVGDKQLCYMDHRLNPVEPFVSFIHQSDLSSQGCYTNTNHFCMLEPYEIDPAVEVKL